MVCLIPENIQLCSSSYFLQVNILIKANVFCVLTTRQALIQVLSWMKVWDLCNKVCCMTTLPGMSHGSCCTDEPTESPCGAEWFAWSHIWFLAQWSSKPQLSGFRAHTPQSCNSYSEVLSSKIELLDWLVNLKPKVIL